MGVSVCVLVALTQLLASATTEHLVYNGKTQEGGGEGVCPGDQQTRTVLDEMDMEVRGVVRNTILPRLAPIGSIGQQYNPANSCSEISELVPGQSSGYYWVRSHNGTAVQVYCDMDRVCGCNSTGGWMRIAHLNTSNAPQKCPDAWRLITTLRRTCGRKTSPSAGCDSAIFPTHELQYSHVCGRVMGHQDGTPNAFTPFHDNHSLTIDSYYVDGVSITHGAPGSRHHVWTFAGSFQPGYCPCSYPQSVPTYVGQDYFCETANDDNEFSNRWFFNDTLWDGGDCWGSRNGRSSACECTFNSPPWFCKQLAQTTTDDIEVRICAEQETNNEDTPVEVIELYIH